MNVKTTSKASVFSHNGTTFAHNGNVTFAHFPTNKQPPCFVEFSAKEEPIRVSHNIKKP